MSPSTATHIMTSRFSNNRLAFGFWFHYLLTLEFLRCGMTAQPQFRIYLCASIFMEH